MMSLQANYEAFEKQLEKDNVQDIGQHWDAMQKWFGSKENISNYMEWSNQELSEKIDSYMMPVGAQYLVKLFDKANYNIDADRFKIGSALQRMHVPPIYAGKDLNGICYRIVPAPWELVADCQEPKTNYKLVETSVLGVNINVQPRLPNHRRLAGMSEESTLSNESDDADNGFVFYQMGRLQEWLGDEPPKSYEDAEKEETGSWWDTSFVVVVRFGSNGLSNGVYLIYDFYPGPYGKREKRTEQSDWGYLPENGAHRQFSLAKIADSTLDLGAGYKFRFTEMVGHPIELVRAVATGKNTIVRVTVGHSK